MSNPSKTHMGAAKHLLWYLTGSIDFNITYKKWGFKLAAFSDANGGKNPDNGKSTSSYMIMCNGPVSFKESMQGLKAQSTTEAELVAAALAMKKTVYCAGMMNAYDDRGTSSHARGAAQQELIEAQPEGVDRSRQRAQ